MGSIPITSQLRDSVLPELASKWDMYTGRPVTNPEQAREDALWLDAYANSVIRAANTEPHILGKHENLTCITPPLRNSCRKMINILAWTSFCESEPCTLCLNIQFILLVK